METLIIIIALEFGLPPQFVLGIALTENPTLNAAAINRNSNGTFDVGLMQLNTSWYKAKDWRNASNNLRAACAHIKWLRSLGLTWWSVAVAYNCGHNRKHIPKASIEYANNVFRLWREAEPQNRQNWGGQ